MLDAADLLPSPDTGFEPTDADLMRRPDVAAYAAQKLAGERISRIESRRTAAESLLVPRYDEDFLQPDTVSAAEVGPPAAEIKVS